MENHPLTGILGKNASLMEHCHMGELQIQWSLTHIKQMHLSISPEKKRACSVPICYTLKFPCKWCINSFWQINKASLLLKTHTVTAPICIK